MKDISRNSTSQEQEHSSYGWKDEELKGTVAAIDEILVEIPEIDLSLDKKTWKSRFPED